MLEDLPSRIRQIVLEEVQVGCVLFPEHPPTVEDVFVGTQPRTIARVRWAIWWRIRHEPGPQGKVPSYPQIGAWFGRNHTTIIHGEKHHLDHVVEWAAAKQQVYAAHRASHNAAAAEIDPNIVVIAA